MEKKKSAKPASVGDVKQKVIKDKKLKEPSKPKEPLIMSKCGNFSKKLASDAHFRDERAYKMLKELHEKKTTMVQKSDLEAVCTDLKKFGLPYKASFPDSKYAYLKCGDCKKFQMWFFNKDGKEMKDLNKVEGGNVDLEFYRMINWGHECADKHKEIEF